MEARAGSAPAEAAPLLERTRLSLADGAATTVHVARFRRAAYTVRVAAMEPRSTLLRWCAESGAAHAIVGGFYMRPSGQPLGEVWIGGRQLPYQPIDGPWAPRRACVGIEAGEIALGPREAHGPSPAGDLLQAGPLLLAGGRPVTLDGEDPEGFSAGAAQFDSDITAGRYPRAALGLNEEELIAVVCDGRSDHDAGLTMAELTAAMATLRAEEAINLDGGGSASLVFDGALVNTPREQHGLELSGGREIATALRFVPR